MEETDDSQPVPKVLPRELRLAVWMRQISLEYQPVVDITTGDLAGVEAYVRWDRPGEGVVPASAFIEHASAALAALDQEVLWVSTSLWASLGGIGAHVPLHINIDLGGATTRLSGLVGRALQETNLDASLLQVDLADHIEPADVEVRRGIEALADLDVFVALDDSGRLSAQDLGALITALPFDSVKVDMRIGDADERVRAISAIALRAGVELAAKRIEDLADLDRAVAAGAHRAQGFLLGRPIAPEHCVELVMADRQARAELVA